MIVQLSKRNQLNMKNKTDKLTVNQIMEKHFDTKIEDEDAKIEDEDVIHILVALRRAKKKDALTAKMVALYNELDAAGMI